MKAPVLQRKCSCGGRAKAGGDCEECRKKRSSLQRKAAGTAPSGASLAPPIVHDVLRQPGQPLDAGTRASIEPRFGHDFSQVRIHADARAAESARAVDARAYTVGRHVVFGESPSRDLLAHELAHVVQQAGAAGSPRRLEVARADGPGEREAERVEHAVARGGRAVLRETAGRTLQRRPIEDPIHQPLIEDFRRRHGLPPGGRDEQGRRVGPSDAEIKYGGLLLPPARRPCPAIQASQDRANLLEAFCLTRSSQASDPACAFTAQQRRHLATATREASQRVSRAHERITSGPHGRRFARDMAGRLFSSDPPTLATITKTLEAMQRFLRGSGPEYDGRTCGDEACHKAVAYVKGAAQLPVFICPRAFLDPASLYMTVIHEVVHLAGIDADPATPEGYCSKFDCTTPCLSRDDADAWSHYLSCLGEPIRIRQDFIPEIERSLEDLP